MNVRNNEDSLVGPLQGGTIHIVAVDPRGGSVYDDIWGTVHVAISIPGGPIHMRMRKLLPFNA